MKISIITTAYNEEKNIVPMYEKIKKAMGKEDYEIIAVDDGSNDKTLAELLRIKDNAFRVIRMKKRLGKSFALYEGIKNANGKAIATIDADQQDDPEDIPKMVKQLDKGYDCVCGWRHKRKDSLGKRITSKIGNFLNNKLLGVNLHDSNCPVKVFRKECISEIRYFENFHRFIPAMIKLQGFKIKECKVRHYPRVYGVSKYSVHGRLLETIKTFLLVKLKHRELLK